MSRNRDSLTRIYHRLLRLYPLAFRAQFEAEMQDVFGQALGDASRDGRGAVAKLWLRELREWPGAVGRAWADCLRGERLRQKGVIMADNEVTYEGSVAVASPTAREPWGQALVAALALLVPGLALAMTELGAINLFDQVVVIVMEPWWWILMFGSYLFILAGTLAGWLKGFPRWSYPYVGYGLLFAFYLSSVSTPGLQILGYTFNGHQPWGWRAWLGLGAVAMIALLVTRSFKPLKQLFTGAWRDWTRVTVALYGGLPLFLWAIFDEVQRPYPAPFLAVSSLCLAAGALATMRSGTELRRVLSLLGGLSASWLVCTVGLAAYWHGRQVGWQGSDPLHWSGTAAPMAVGWVAVVLVLMMPGVLGLLRHRVGPGRPA